MWNIHGVISPIIDGEISPHRSPYEIGILEFVQTFSFSSERIAILRNFLLYRSFMYEVGVKSGFQWVNGSFSENVEVLRQRPPNDVDVVTFIDELNNLTDSFELLGDNAYIKNKYQVDSYLVDLNDSPDELVKLTAYWYSLWSHQRDTLIWKGFFQIALSQDEDLKATQYLDSLENDNV